MTMEYSIQSVLRKIRFGRIARGVNARIFRIVGPSSLQSDHPVSFQKATPTAFATKGRRLDTWSIAAILAEETVPHLLVGGRC
jgi:hypothetical protein